MHLLSSPAHLFSIVLLSIVLGVMTMAVPLTARNTDIGKWQWHSNALFTYIVVNNVMLVRRYGEKSSTDNQPAVARTMMLHIKEHGSCTLPDTTVFMQYRRINCGGSHRLAAKKRYFPCLFWGLSIQEGTRIATSAWKLFYSNQKTMTGPNQFAAINAAIQMLSSNEVEGVAYTPTQEDPNAWKEIYMAMTDYAQYEKVFRKASTADFRMITTDAQRTVLITKGLARVKKGLARVTGAGGQLGKKSKKQGGMSSSTDPMRISK
ncbi:hypothetical protein DFH05DRAFT_1506771 [Lentinula detonsa]|uniref:Uncharacterized protein n=1 Tax=Lentinula detonsa TaxID=2804962 RepID=A0A9W8TVK0_9AGAR|nr:hypothetical protein DFH05DRAFT_1506771 [Lentinula detonsa]